MRRQAVGPPVYVLFADLVRPRRHYVLRHDVHGLVHFALDEMRDSANAVPWCHFNTGARLVVFFRHGNEVPDMPTCLWCMNEFYKRARRAS